jgi:16S rRNA (guanine527-N7)-methyltransferase
MFAPEREELELLRQIYPVSRETIERLETYRRLLETWQAKTNLVAPNTLAQFWSRHVADSLQVKRICPDVLRFADLGSGGGFPGMVIAIANAGVRDAEHHLVESLAKKCAFLRSVARETGASVIIHNERIESAAERIAALPSPPQIVTARALAPLKALLGLAEPMIKAGAKGIFHKGREYVREIEECRGLWRFDLVVHDSKVETGSVLLEVANLERLTS